MEESSPVELGDIMSHPLSLSTAYVTAGTGTEWLVMSQDNKVLGKLPKDWTVGEAMKAVHLGRKYEVEAFNRGIAFGKETRDRAYKPKMETLNEAVRILSEMNEKLSDKLEKFIIGED